FDETGFRGTKDLPYRTDAWEFLLAGGSTYDHLDYSFTAAHPDGTAEVHEPTPGGGGPALRRQLKILKEFVDSFDFVRMAPDETTVRSVSSGTTTRVLSQKGKAYAIYLEGGTQATVVLDVPAGRYLARWVDTRTGDSLADSLVEVKGGSASL